MGVCIEAVSNMSHAGNLTKVAWHLGLSQNNYLCKAMFARCIVYRVNANSQVKQNDRGRMEGNHRTAIVQHTPIAPSNINHTKRNGHRLWRNVSSAVASRFFTCA